MAKSKNSSQHNQNAKGTLFCGRCARVVVFGLTEFEFEAHRNGIKKPKTFRYPSLKGTDPKFRRNHRSVGSRLG